MSPRLHMVLSVLKRLAAFLAVGGVIGDVVTMMTAPQALAWFQTPGTGSALCNCADVARQTADALVRAQLVGTGIGAVGGAVLGELITRLWLARRERQGKARTAAESVPSPPPASPPSSPPSSPPAA